MGAKIRRTKKYFNEKYQWGVRENNCEVFVGLGYVGNTINGKVYDIWGGNRGVEGLIAV